MIESNQSAIIAENIKKYLRINKMTQTELASRVGISKSTMSDYMALRSQPSHGVLEKIAGVFGVGKSDIDTTYKDSISDTYVVKEGEEVYSVSPIVELPIIGRVSCGKGIVAYEDIEGYEPTPKSWLNGGEYFYLRAKGDSMIDAHINDGDLLFIRQQEDVENSEIAAVYIDGEAVLKRVIKNYDGTLTLRSENPDHVKYPPMIFKEGNVRIIGKLEKSVTLF